MTVPCAVAAIARDDTGGTHLYIRFAFAVSKLAQCHFAEICRPASDPLCGECGLPDFFRLGIGSIRRVAAYLVVRMLNQSADRFKLAFGGFCRNAFCGVIMLDHLHLAADEIAFIIQATIVMQMENNLFPAAY